MTGICCEVVFRPELKKVQAMLFVRHFPLAFFEKSGIFSFFRLITFGKLPRSQVFGGEVKANSFFAVRTRSARFLNVGSGRKEKNQDKAEKFY